MEEILSSIRRIIADEESEESHPEDDELGAAEAHADALNEDADALARAAEDEDQDDVLELTRVVREGGEVVDLKAGGAGATGLYGEPPGEPESEPVTEIDRGEVELAPPDEERDGGSQIPTWHESKQKEPTAVETKSFATGAELVSAPVANATSGAFAKLSEAVHKTPPEESIADDSGRTIEQFVEDMIRPLLKEWLDENLPPIVERLVQREIQKIARRAELV
jgi:cell pole-organizing protein PopZ